jgi:hypothetical protein
MIWPGNSDGGTSPAQTTIRGGASISGNTTAGQRGDVNISGGENSSAVTTGSVAAGYVYILGGTVTNASAGVTKYTGGIYISGGGSGAGGTITYGDINIGTLGQGTTYGTGSVNIGINGIVTTINGTVKLPNVGTSGFVKLGAGGQLSADTNTYLTGTKVDSITATSPIVASASTGAVTLTHATSGVTAGTYNNVTVNATGHVTGGSNSSYLTAEADTLATVTGRGASATTAIDLRTAQATSTTGFGTRTWNQVPPQLYLQSSTQAIGAGGSIGFGAKDSSTTDYLNWRIRSVFSAQGGGFGANAALLFDAGTDGGGTTALNNVLALFANGNASVAGVIKTGSNSATGLANGAFNVAKTVIGGLHFNNGGGANANGYQAAITFQGATADEAQAGIYVHNNGNDGTHMAFATTGSYATGPQIAISVTNSGVVNFPRARPTWNGSGLALLSEAGTTTNSVTFTSSGGAAAGTTFNGSTARTIDYSTVGAASSTHNHQYNVNNDWLRDFDDNANVKLYGNSRQMAFRTDGTTEYASGVGAYPFAWMYGGDAASNRLMLLNTTGDMWTSTNGWLSTALAGKQNTGSYLTSESDTLQSVCNRGSATTTSLAVNSGNDITTLNGCLTLY